MPLKVRDALRIGPLSLARVVGGAQGLDREITSVNVMEVPDIIDYVRPGALLLTTGYPIKDDPAVQARLVPKLAEKGLAALGINPGRYLTEIPAAMIAAADELAFPLLELPHHTSFNDILHPVLSEILNRQAFLLKRAEEIHYRFTDVVLSGGGLPDIVHILSEIVRAPVTVEDPDFRPLASAIPEGLRGLTEPLRQAIEQYSGRRVSVADASHVRCETVLGDTVVGRFVQPIYSAGQVHGYLSVWEVEQRVQDLDVVAIERAATVCALAMLKDRAVTETEKRFQSEFLNDVLSGHFESVEEVVARARTFGWDLTRPYAVLLAAPDGTGKEYVGADTQGRQRLHTLQAAALQVVSAVTRSGRCKAIVASRGSGVLLLYHPEPDQDDVQCCKRLGNAIIRASRSVLAGTAMSVGIGRTAPDVASLQKSYQEARLAADVARRVWGGNCAVHFDDLGAYRLLARIHDRQELRAFHRDTVGKLVEYDRHHGTELVQTLEAFLACNGSLQNTAGQLYIHYNTLRYRLERIERILGVGLDSAEVRFNLQLGLKVRRLIASQPR